MYFHGFQLYNQAKDPIILTICTNFIYSHCIVSWFNKTQSIFRFHTRKGKRKYML